MKIAIVEIANIKGIKTWTIPKYTTLIILRNMPQIVKITRKLPENIFFAFTSFHFFLKINCERNLRSLLWSRLACNETQTELIFRGLDFLWFKIFLSFPIAYWGWWSSGCILRLGSVRAESGRKYAIFSILVRQSPLKKRSFVKIGYTQGGGAKSEYGILLSVPKLLNIGSLRLALSCIV